MGVLLEGSNVRRLAFIPAHRRGEIDDTPGRGVAAQDGIGMHGGREEGIRRMAPPSTPDEQGPGLGAALLATAAARVIVVTLVLTVLWGTDMVSHLVQDLRTWREFFLATQAGAIPYVHLTKEYPVLGGILYWLMSPFVDAEDLKQTIAVHAVFMGVADLLNAAIF